MSKKKFEEVIKDIKVGKEAMRLLDIHLETHEDKKCDNNCLLCRSLRRSILKGI